MDINVEVRIVDKNNSRDIFESGTRTNSPSDRILSKR